MIRLSCGGCSDRSFIVDPLRYFSFEPVLYSCCDKGHGLYYFVFGMVHIKDPLPLNGKSSPRRDGSGFPLSLSGARCSSVVRAFAYVSMSRRIDPFMVDPISYFSFQPVLHDWCNKGRDMGYPVCGMMHIKEPLLLIGKSSPRSGDSGFPLSLSEWY